jgi:DNA-binding GntR family transcriptional regulator
MPVPSAIDISERIVKAVLASKLAPGARLGEQPLCELFAAPRAVVREALTTLSVRGIVKASARRGWYLVELSFEEAEAAFDARLVIETGLMRCAKLPGAAALKKLRAHLKTQRAAVGGVDAGLRSFLLGDFHVCLAECLGNTVLANTVRDLTARTMLIASRYQSDEEASHSFGEHVAIVDALEAGDMALAEELVSSHLSTWQLKLRMPAETAPDPLAELRRALEPMTALA